MPPACFEINAQSFRVSNIPDIESSFIDSRKQDEEKHRLDKVMRTKKPWYSEVGYMDIIRGLQQASHFEKLDFIRNMEKAIVKRRETS